MFIITIFIIFNAFIYLYIYSLNYFYYLFIIKICEIIMKNKNILKQHKKYKPQYINIK